MDHRFRSSILLYERMGSLLGLCSVELVLLLVVSLPCEPHSSSKLVAPFNLATSLTGILLNCSELVKGSLSFMITSLSYSWPIYFLISFSSSSWLTSFFKDSVLGGGKGGGTSSSLLESDASVIGVSKVGTLFMRPSCLAPYTTH